ncbi:hypothetical protein GV829_04615 [Sphingomonas lacunae]|uniref:Phage tail protein n=1 Tax=Sphingomonas lacunae TaxID=2698828 RepID=A0A6M4ARV8_9SPHN|nr:portal protein [Sphingomonas lacunae]QJQ31818.1 hypothetical protein GV829_04615 [Sphingomonas lacunae]
MAATEQVDDILHRFSEMESARQPWESAWREIDERINPLGQGGFSTKSQGGVRGVDIFDHTASEGLNRFQAAYTGMIIPRGERYHQLITTDSALNDLPAAQRWLEEANDKLFAMRYAPMAGFDPEAGMNIRSLGSYGCGPLWIDHWVGRGIFYKCLHMSEVYIAEDFRGRVDTVARKFKQTVRQFLQQFGRDNLPPSIAKAVEGNELSREFDVLHVVRPRADVDPERLDFRRLSIESLYVLMADKVIVREGGYSSMPITVSRYVTGPREIYGRSPALQVLGTIRTANEIMKTLLRQAHKAVDPPLLLPEDGVLTRVGTMPGGANVGGLDFNGRPMVVPLQTGGQLGIGMDMLNNEREVVRDAFLEKVWSLILDRKDRMTATEVLEISRMQGMLLAPMASRQEAEWLGPQIERELDIGMSSGYIPPMPPEMREAGARVKVIYDNPLSRAAKAEEAIGFSRYIETLIPLANIVGEEVFDVIDTEAAPRELGRALAVQQKYMAPPDAVAAKREDRAQRKAQESVLAALPAAAGAVKDLASARAQETAYAG